MANYTATLYNPAAEPDSRSTYSDVEGPEDAIAWCELQIAQHVPPNYQPGWTADVVDDATSEVVWPE